MTQSRAVRVLTAGLLLLAFAALTGCAKKATAPDSGFTTLEGVPTDDILLVGWQQPELIEAHFLQATTGGAEAVFDYSTPIAPDSAGRLMAMAFDHSIASGLEVFRSYPNGSLSLMFDFALRPFIKDLVQQRDYFQFQDAAPVSGDERFIVRGTLSGSSSSGAPISNSAHPAGVIEQSILPTSADRFRDSIAVFSWTPDPRATLYIVNILDFGEIAATRSKAILSGFPTPVYPDPTVAQATLLTTSTQIPFNFTGARFPIRLIVRVAAVDANARIVNRLNPGALSLTTTPPSGRDAYKFKFTEEAPANFNAFSVLPIGGVKVVFDPFNQDVSAPQFAATRLRQASRPFNGFPISRLQRGLELSKLDLKTLGTKSESVQK